MATIITKEHYTAKMRLCAKGKHKIRTNAYGVTFCVVCGLLSNTNNAEPLQEEDKLIIE